MENEATFLNSSDTKLLYVHSGNALSVKISTVIFHLIPYLLSDLPETPQNLMAVNLTSRNFTLTWLEPHDNNAPIQGYMYVTNVFSCSYHIRH